jgi:kumamolisin
MAASKGMAQDKVELKGSLRSEPKDAEVVGAPAPDEVIELTVVVRRRAPLPSDWTGPPLSREEVTESYGADPADLHKVGDFALSNRLTVAGSDAARRTVLLTGTVADMSRAFGTELRLYRSGHRTFRGRTGPLWIPANLDGIIEGVFGFDQRPQARNLS